MTETTPRESPLAACHQQAGARFTEFAGWNMPLLYTSILAEHQAVRERAGLFDISHMGEIRVTGPGAEAWLNTQVTNDLGRLAPQHAQYSLFLNENGGVIDDLMIYRLGSDAFLIIANASRYERVAALLLERAPAGVSVADESDATAAVALQGPLAGTVFERAFGQPMVPRNEVADLQLNGIPVFVAGTGYTGESGCEWFFPAAQAGVVWEKLLAAGGADLQPCGLACRDSLRLEVCYPLNGQDLDEAHTPLEAGLGIFVKLEKGPFTGSEPLQRQKNEGVTRRLAAFIMEGKTPPPRSHCAVLHEGQPIGEVTSGVQSPSLQKGIGMAYVETSHASPDTAITIQIRNKPFPARTTRKPIYRKP